MNQYTPATDTAEAAVQARNAAAPASRQGQAIGVALLALCIAVATLAFVWIGQRAGSGAQLAQLRERRAFVPHRPRDGASDHRVGPV